MPNNEGVHTCVVNFDGSNHPFILQAPTRESVVELVRVLYQNHPLDWAERCPTLIGPNGTPAALTYDDVYRTASTE